jgi:hypothetical protein
MLDIYVPHQKKKVAKYRWRMYNRWQFALTPMVSSSDMTYENVVSVPVEKHNIHDIHHPMERYLPSYLGVCASLQESKLQKVKVESKSQLALPPDKTTIVLIWASKRFLTVGFHKYDRT